MYSEKAITINPKFLSALNPKDLVWQAVEPGSKPEKKGASIASKFEKLGVLLLDKDIEGEVKIKSLSSEKEMKLEKVSKKRAHYRLFPGRYQITIQSGSKTLKKIINIESSLLLALNLSDFA